MLLISRKKISNFDLNYGNHISWEIENEIGYISLSDPPENKMTKEFFEELKFITNRIIPVSNARAIIISGKARHFSSGADLESLLTSIKNEKSKGKMYQNLLANYQAFQDIDNLRIPVIAAIRGVCIGSAFELTLHCHFRLCTEDAILGLPETTFDLMPGVGGIPKLISLTGKAKTIELTLSGNTFNASDALKWNIVDAVYPKKEIMIRSIELAKQTSGNYRKYKKMEYLKILNTPD